jgi:glycosyltransferase involved in cell wall biosynthesis
MLAIERMPMSFQNRPIVLTLAPHYLPGFKAGGPIRSVANLVANLGDAIDFRIITRDRDLGDTAAYAGSDANRWRQVGRAHVSYVRPSKAAPLRTARAIHNLGPNVLYVNSFFDAFSCLGPLALTRFRAAGHTPIIIAPRGQFAASALQFKSAQKWSYFQAFRSLGLAKRVIWQASCEGERLDIHRVFGKAITTVVAPDLSSIQAAHNRRQPKQEGKLQLVYLSRVAPVKNLLGAIDLLARVSGDVAFDIWGPIEDHAYAERCRRQIAALPANIEVRWRGAVQPLQVADTLSHYDAMLLPTLGENFGHAIVESLAARCPVIISDRTPWRNLPAHGAGWDLPLDQSGAFRQAIEALCRMDDAAHERLRRGAAEFAAKVMNSPGHLDANRQLFQLALDAGGPPRDGRWLQIA